MKFFVAFIALIAVAAATPVYYNKPGSTQDSQLDAIIAAINSPNTDPATAALLEQQLQQIIGAVVNPESIAVGPTLVEGNEPISVGPALVEGNEPISVGPVIVDDALVTAPVIVSPTPVAPESSNAPALIQIIVNIQSSGGQSPGFVVSPIEVPSQLPEFVQIVDQSPETVNVVDQAPETVNVVDQAPETVNVVDQAPENVNVVDLVPEVVNVVDAPPETVNVVQPIMPAPVINVPDSLN